MEVVVYRLFLCKSILMRFAVKSYRCLRDIDIDLKPLTVVVGENNTGKTRAVSGRLLGKGQS